MYMVIESLISMHEFDLGLEVNSNPNSLVTLYCS